MSALTLPRNLPSTANAKLPRTYESAKTALAECYRIDECKEWADKAAALASYAKQAQDNSLYETAQRIHGRAIRRVGELLAQVLPQPGKRTDVEPGRGAPPRLSPPTRKQVAAQAGLSRDQQKQALRVAAVPDFEELIEQSPPPTVTALAERGKKPAPPTLSELHRTDEVLPRTPYSSATALHHCP